MPVCMESKMRIPGSTLPVTVSFLGRVSERDTKQQEVEKYDHDGRELSWSCHESPLLGYSRNMNRTFLGERAGVEH